MLHYICQVDGQNKETGLWDDLKEFRTEGYVEWSDSKFWGIKFKKYERDVYTKTRDVVRKEAREFAESVLTGKYLSIVIDEYGFRPDSEYPKSDYGCCWHIAKIWQDGKWL